MYLIEKNCEIVECETLTEVLSNFNIDITKTGEVIFEGIKHPTSYNMKQFTPEEVFKDFARYALPKLVKVYKGDRL